MAIRFLYNVGEKVLVDGVYVCVPCGHKHRLWIGEVFPACLDCMQISKVVSDIEFGEAAARGEEIDEFDQNAFTENLEVWELIRKTKHRNVCVI